MLKIKSNTNEFTIIFSEKIEKKINAEKILCFSPLFLSSAFPFLLFFFLPYLFKVQPFTCCSLTQPKKPKRFSAQTFLLQFSHSFFLFFSALFFSGSAQKCYIQPKTFFSCFMSLYLSKSSFSSNLK